MRRRVRRELDRTSLYTPAVMICTGACVRTRRRTPNGRMNARVSERMNDRTYELDLGEGIVAILQEKLHLPRVDAHDTEQQMTLQA